MEHQSSVTYGNGYQNGYRGRDLSGTGWGLKFDFIIIHEAGHEWFANNITYKDEADMWIHESFTNYSESLFLDYHYGKEAGQAYVRGTRMNILNDKPIIGDYGVNQRGSGDMYYKGGNLLNMLRQILQDDAKWRMILRGLNTEFYHQTVNTKQVESFIAQRYERDISSVFDQYLRDHRVPLLEYYHKEGELFYRWTDAIPSFSMVVDINLDGKEIRLHPNTSWQKISTPAFNVLSVEPNYYVGTLKSK